MPGSATVWDPEQYNRFAREREQPLWDLCSLVERVPVPRVADLGCGDGRLTAALHRRFGARRTVGVDNSPEMLAQAAAHADVDVRFVDADIAQWSEPGQEIVISNAALQWMPHHEVVLGRWRAALNAGGQLAVQIPANADHPSHVVLRQLAEERWGVDAPPDPVASHVLAPEAYAGILDALGFASQHVRLQVYCHRLVSAGDVVEWVRGSSLRRFSGLMQPPEFERFVAEYRARLLTVLGNQAPYLYLFKRILLWGRLPGGPQD